MWSSLFRNQPKTLLFTVPAAVATCCAVAWVIRCWRRRENPVKQVQRSHNNVAMDPCDEVVDLGNEEQPLGSGMSLSTEVVSGNNSGVAKPFPSPTDSGYQEPSSPDNPKCSNAESISVMLTPQILPSTPCSIPCTSPTIDTTIIRGGRARATIQLPIDIIGRFIGRRGKNIKSLMAESGAQIHVQQKNLSKDATIVPCILQGTLTQINKAIDLICLCHPEVSLPSSHVYLPPLPIYPGSSANNSAATSWSYRLKPPQVPSSAFLAIVTYIEKLNRVWLVPYSSTQLLEELHQSMASAYKTEEQVDEAAESVDEERTEEDIVGKFCAARVNEIYWLRGKIVIGKNENTHYEVRLIDYGSSVIVPASSLKPLRLVTIVVLSHVCLLSVLLS